MVAWTNVNNTLQKGYHAWYPKMIIFDKDGKSTTTLNLLGIDY